MLAAIYTTMDRNEESAKSSLPVMQPSMKLGQIEREMICMRIKFSIVDKANEYVCGARRVGTV